MGLFFPFLARRGGKLWAYFPPQLPVDECVGGFRFKGGVMSSEKNSTLKYAIVLNILLEIKWKVENKGRDSITRHLQLIRPHDS